MFYKTLVLAMQFSKNRPRHGASRGGGMRDSGAELDGGAHPFCLVEQAADGPLPQNRAVKTGATSLGGAGDGPAGQLRGAAGWLVRRGRGVRDATSASARRRNFPATRRRMLRTGECFLRKEVIQPHLPVRLPCYDFTPIANPTFDGSLPKGLGHRLRVLPTFVV